MRSFLNRRAVYPCRAWNCHRFQAIEPAVVRNHQASGVASARRYVATRDVGSKRKSQCTGKRPVHGIRDPRRSKPPRISMALLTHTLPSTPCRAFLYQLQDADIRSVIVGGFGIGQFQVVKNLLIRRVFDGDDGVHLLVLEGFRHSPCDQSVR